MASIFAGSLSYQFTPHSAPGPEQFHRLTLGLGHHRD
jgi:hypothetical protein